MKLRKRPIILGAVAALAAALLGFSIFATTDSKPESSSSNVGLVQGTVVVNFAGSPSQRPASTTTFKVEPGTNAWTAIQQAVGPSNLTSQDFGGDLGILITGFYGVPAQGNNFWEFLVNGQSSGVGVSGYIVRDGDRLEFRYSSF